MSPGLVLALVALVGVIVLGAVAVVGIIVCFLVRELDHLVNGWSRGDDDGDDGGPFEPPPPPDDPTARALPDPAPLTATSGPCPGTVDGRPRLAQDQAVLAAPHLAQNLHRLSGATREQLARYADPLPGHADDCGCTDCTYRLAGRYSAAVIDDVIARCQPAGPDRDGDA